MISKDEILERTNRGLDVFKYYLGMPFKPGKNFRNPLYEDKNASCNIYFDKHSMMFKMKDFGNEGYSGDCFWFVATLKGMNLKTDFVSIINLIAKDLHLDVVTDSKQSLHPIRRKKEATIQIIEVDVPIYEIVEKTFTCSELEYWQQYGITKVVLDTFHVSSVNVFKSVNRNNEPFKIKSSEIDPVFAYKGLGYVKIYRPMNKKYRFLYGGEMPDTYCFGFEQLPNKGDIVFITGGEKDVMSLYAKGFHALCFNSETATIPIQIIEMLERKFRHIIFLYDSDETGKRESLRQCSTLSGHNVIRIELPLPGTKKEKDISDFFASGKTKSDLQALITGALEKYYSNTLMLIKSCEMDYNNPPQNSKTVVSVNNVPLGTYDNLLCVTGGEGTGKSNFISAIIAGTLIEVDEYSEIDTLGLDITPNFKHKAILHYDTEQSEYQLYKNMTKTLKRSGLSHMPDSYHSFYLASLSRKERLDIIRDSMDLYYHRFGGIHLVVIDGIADLIRSANDEAESVAIVDELYRLAGIYRTCIICVLHFVPNGIKLRGHIGSELQRKAAAIISIEKDDNPVYSVVKAIKVRDGSPLDVPLLQFSWDTDKDMHIFAGEKPVEDKERRKRNDLFNVAKEIFYTRKSLSYSELSELLCEMLDVKERTSKNYIQYMKSNGIISQNTYNNYIAGKLCNI